MLDTINITGGADASFVHSQFTLGGDRLKDVRIAPLGPEHYEQRDKSLNEVIWSLYPVGVDWETLSERIEDATQSRDLFHEANGPYWASGHGAKLVELHERLRVLVNYQTMIMIHRDLCSDHSHLAPERMPQPKVLLDIVNCCVRAINGATTDMYNVPPPAARHVMSVKEHVARATQCKEEGNERGQYWTAVGLYHFGLAALYPWTATPLLFNPADAVATGIAKIEASLWFNLSVAFLKLRGTGTGLTFEGCGAVMCIEAIIESRYAAPSTLAKAYKYMAEARRWMAHQLEDSKEPRDIVVIDQAPLFAQASDKVAQGIERIVGVREWAHQRCYDVHVCAGVSMSTAFAMTAQPGFQGIISVGTQNEIIRM